MANKDLFEWYDGMGGSQVVPASPPPEESPAEKEVEPEQEVKNIEKGAEVAKVMAMTRALDNKLSLLTGIFQGYTEPEKRKALKTEVKELAKRINEIISEL